MSKTTELANSYVALLADTRVYIAALVEGLPGRIRTRVAPGSPHMLYIDPAAKTIRPSGGSAEAFDIDDLPLESLISLCRLLEDEAYDLDDDEVN